MNEGKPILINSQAIMSIKGFAHRRFDDARGFGDMDTKEVQAALIVGGLEDYLRSKGVEPGFTVDPKIGGK
jgi:hypothetical protein